MKRLKPDEVASVWRFLADDGQTVEVECIDGNLARSEALAYFEQNTRRPKPAKGSSIWVRIEGVARLDEPDPQEALPL